MLRTAGARAAHFRRAENLHRARRASSDRFEDNGPGVPAALREQIFNPFFTSKKDGVGMGLAIVAKIVDDHGGWIRLEESSNRRRAVSRISCRPRPQGRRKSVPVAASEDGEQAGE